MDPLLKYACRRVAELESLLLVDISETVWPAEVGMVYSQIENAGDLPAHHQRRLKHHINRMWLEKILGTVDCRCCPFAGRRHGGIRVKEIIVDNFAAWRRGEYRH